MDRAEPGGVRRYPGRQGFCMMGTNDVGAFCHNSDGGGGKEIPPCQAS